MIGLGEGETSKSFGLDPSNRLAANRPGTSGNNRRLQGMERDAKMAVRVADDDPFGPDANPDSQLLANFSDKRFAERFAFLDLSSGEFPKPSEQSPVRPAVDQNFPVALPAKDRRDHSVMRDSLGGHALGERRLLSVRLGLAKCAEGAEVASRISRKANCRAEFHNALVEVTGTTRRDEAFGQFPQSFFRRGLVWILADAKDARPEANGVSVEDRFGSAKGDGRDGAGGVSPDSGQRG